MARLFLHVGFHKTGTTNLQYLLSTNRTSLLKEGFLYPKTKRFRAHHDFALALSERKFGWQDNGGKIVHRRHIKRIIRIINRSRRDVIISSEFLSTLSAEKISRLKGDIKKKEVKILFTLRPISKILPSAYQQEVKNGSKLQYEDWLSRIFGAKDNKLKTRVWGRHNHHQEILKWTEVFGAENVFVIISDEKNPDFLISEFMKVIGSSENILNRNRKASLNRSLTVEELQLLLKINSEFDRNLGWQEYVNLVRGTFVKAWTDREPLSSSSDKLVNPAEFEEHIRSKANEIKRGLQILNLNLIGDLESLQEVKIGILKKPTKIDIQNLVDPVMSRNIQNVLKNYSLAQLVRIKIDTSLRRFKKRNARKIKKLIPSRINQRV